MIKTVDLYEQYISIKEDIDRAIAEVIAASAFIKGEAVTELENELAAFLDVKHCITCGNGTDAIMLSLMATAIGRGDEVIMPAFAFASVAEAVLLLGGTPVFADVDPHTFNIDPASVERVISAKTKAIVPVHLFGQSCDMASLMAIARRHHLIVIEDNAQSLGAKCRLASGQEAYAGTVGTIGCTSFFPSKVLGCFGDGGAVFTNDSILADRIRTIANHGQHVKYTHETIGLNSRLDTLQAAVLRAKLPHLPRWIEARRDIAERYSEALKGIGQIGLPVRAPYSSHVYHQYTIKTSPASRDSLRKALAAQDIQSMIYYPKPLSDQPAYRESCVCDPAMNNCRTLSESVLSLPIYSELDRTRQNLVIEAIRNYFTDKTTFVHE